MGALKRTKGRVLSYSTLSNKVRERRGSLGHKFLKPGLCLPKMVSYELRNYDNK